MDGKLHTYVVFSFEYGYGIHRYRHSSGQLPPFKLDKDDPLLGSGMI